LAGSRSSVLGLAGDSSSVGRSWAPWCNALALQKGQKAIFGENVWWWPIAATCLAFQVDPLISGPLLTSQWPRSPQGPPTPVIAWLAAGVGARAFRDAVLVGMYRICRRRYGA
jgi:hypothetical protein